MEDKPRDLLYHLKDLRQCLIVSILSILISFCIFYPFSEKLFGYLVLPLTNLLKEAEITRKLIYTGVSEVFLTYIKVSLLFSLFFSSPIICYQLWKFIAPGLYKKEKLIFILLLVFPPLLFFGGAIFSYKVVFPLAYRFFLSFETVTVSGVPIQLEARVSECFSFILHLLMAFGLSFQMPIIICLIGWAGLLRYETLLEKWRYAILIIAILSAIITPPDLFSMVALMVPLMGLYGLSLFLLRVTSGIIRKSN